jgi:RNA polymerase sigma-70 factor (ECF subfamily)
MHDNDWLAQRFEEDRARLTSIASRMLGSASDADDAVQEAWLRLSRSDADSIEHLSSWLTTVLSRVCLNILQARRSRPESPLEANGLDDPADDSPESDPEQEALLADSIGLALTIMLDTLSPSERVAFVLHDIFGIPFEEIAPIVGRNDAAARKLASRARVRVRMQDGDQATNQVRQANLVEAFLAAARKGDFDQLLAVLDPDVVLRADRTTVALGAPTEAHGAMAVARFCRRARGAVPALVNGEAAVAWAPNGRVRVLFTFTTVGSKITAIDLIADPDHLRALDLIAPLEGRIDPTPHSG